MRRKSTSVGTGEFYSCHYSCRLQYVMYWKAFLCFSVCWVYVNTNCIQRDRRIINGHPMPTGEVYVYLHKFSKILVFLD
jgi:hypothetical protein